MKKPIAEEYEEQYEKLLNKIGGNLSVEQMYLFLILFKNIRDKECDIDKK